MISKWAMIAVWVAFLGVAAGGHWWYRWSGNLEVTGEVAESVARVSVTRCNDRRIFSDWHSQCEYIFSFDETPLYYEDGVKTRLTLIYDGRNLRLVAMVPDWFHNRFYTNRMPTLAVLSPTTYVAERAFFSGHNRSPVLTVGDRSFSSFRWTGDDEHWIASETDTANFLDVLLDGAEVDVQYFNMAAGEETATISLSGFSTALEYIDFGSAAAEVNETPPMTPSAAIAAIAHLLTTNSFGVSADNLVAHPNPQGRGYFVSVPETRFSGAERKFIWFVVNGTAMKLNGATNNLTPDLPWPREVGSDALDGSGLWASEVLRVGLALAFSE